MISRILIRLAVVWAWFAFIVGGAVVWSMHTPLLWLSLAIWALGPLALAYALAWAFRKPR